MAQMLSIFGHIDITDYAGESVGTRAHRWLTRPVDPEIDDVDEMAQDIMDWLMSNYEGIEHYFEFTYVKPAPISHGKIFNFVGTIRLESPFVEEFLDITIDADDEDQSNRLSKELTDRGLTVREVYEV